MPCKSLNEESNEIKQRNCLSSCHLIFAHLFTTCKKNWDAVEVERRDPENVTKLKIALSSQACFSPVMRNVPPP